MQIDKKFITKMSELGLEERYKGISHILDEYLRFRTEFQSGKRKRHSVGFAANMLTFHPAVAEKITFNFINDKADVPALAKSEPTIDCTNSSHGIAALEEPDNNVNFSPMLQASIPVGLFGLRSSGALHGQWSLAYAAISHVISARNGFDSRFPASGCLGQCHSVFYWAQYHSVSGLFLPFQYSHTLVQIFVAVTYHFLMQLLAITGFTLIFLHTEQYEQRPRNTTEQSLEIVRNRWSYYSKQTQYEGVASEFPLSDDEIPGIPRCFSFEWMYRSKASLRFRMFLTTTLVLACFAF